MPVPTMITRLIPFGLLLALAPVTGADEPGWWVDRGVKTSAPASNQSPATVGQAKHMAAMALRELQLRGRFPAAQLAELQTAVAAVVDLEVPVPPPGYNPVAPPPGYIGPNNHVLLVGELKALALPFYDHLRQWNSVWLDNEMITANIRVVEPGSNPSAYSPYPWSVNASDDENTAITSLGQLKAVFSLRLEMVPAYDADGDGMPDTWEVSNGLDPAADDSAADPDMDGLPNAGEFLASTNPRDPDSDGDLLYDGWEVLFGFDPLSKDLDAFTADPDADGFSNFLESVYGTDPFDPASMPPGIPDVEIIVPPLPPTPPLPPPPPPSTAGSNWHFELVTSRKHLPKYGFAEFIASNPPKRYLRKTETVAFSLRGDGEDPESRINGTRFTHVDPATGTETIQDLQHEGNDNMNGSVEPKTATEAVGESEVEKYEDAPNQQPDRDATKTLKHLLETENTTKMLADNAIKALPPYPEAYADGTPMAYRNLLEAELGIDYQRVKYRIVWNDGVAAEDRHPVKWLVVFEPEDNPATPENESQTAVEIVKVVEWSGQDGQSEPYEINPETERPGKDGRFFLMPVDITVVFGVGPGAGDNGTSSKQNLESYLETVKASRIGDIWCIKGLAGRLYSIEVGEDEVALQHSLARSGQTVIFDGHANFGIGPNFSEATHKTINSFTNFGAGATDLPVKHRGDGTETDVMPYINGQIPWPVGEELDRLLEIERLIDLEGWAYLIVDEANVKGDVTNYPLPHIQGRWKYETAHALSAGDSLLKQGTGVTAYHFVKTETLSKRIVISAPGDDVPALRYKSFFYNSCSSGPHFIENFQHGEFIYTNRSCAGFEATALYVKGLIEEKTTTQILDDLEAKRADGEQNKDVITYEFKVF